MSLSFFNRLTTLDFLARPIYKRGTKAGALASTVMVLVFFWYSIQIIVEASKSQVVTTSVNSTPYDSNSSLVLTISCPKIENLADPYMWGSFDADGNLIQNTHFTHCFVYTPSCPGLKIQGKKSSDNLFQSTVFIAAGDTATIEICYEVQAFYSGTARLEDGGMDCMASPNFDPSNRPSWPLTFYSADTPHIDKLEYNEGFMSQNGEVYTYNSVFSSDINGVVTDSSFMSSNGEPSGSPVGKALQPLIGFLCKPSAFNYTYIHGENFPGVPDQVEYLPGIYSQSTINYKTETVNKLRSNTLTVLGSVGGAWSGICLLAGLALTFYRFFFPSKSVPVDYEVLGINNPAVYEPPKVRNRPWLLKFDFLMAPVYNLGTTIGTGITLMAFAVTLIYLIYLFSNARNSDISTTNVLLTPNVSSSIVPWTVTCPDVLIETVTEQEYSHCIFVQPDCVGNTFQKIKAGETQVIQTCLQTSVFYSGAAIITSDGSKVQCQGIQSPSRLYPVIAFSELNDGSSNSYPTVLELENQTLAKVEVIGFKSTQISGFNGENQTINTLTITQSYAIGYTKADFIKEGTAMAALDLCDDPTFDFFGNMTYLQPAEPGSKAYYLSFMPDAFRYSPQYVQTTFQNELRSNWLALIGSASGAMSGLFFVCALLYIFVPAPKLNAVALGYIPKEKEHLNVKTSPDVPKKSNWLGYIDLLVEPLYNNPTSGGGLLSISSIILYLLYVIYTFGQAGATILQSTSVEITPKSGNSTVATLTFYCPPMTELVFGSQILGSVNPPQQFGNCFIYSPNCTALGDNGLITLKPDTRKTIDICVQRNPFYAGMIGDPKSINCTGENAEVLYGTYDNFQLPIVAWNSDLKAGSFAELADQGGEMSFFSPGESYTYLNSVEEGLTGPAVISNVLTQRDSAPKVSAKKIASALQPLADLVCINSFSLEKLYVGNYSTADTGPMGQINPAPFSFSSIYYNSKRVNTLRYSWLSILGAIAGMWGTILVVFQGLYILLKLIYPPDPLDLIELNIISEDKVKKSAVIKEDAASPALAGSPEKLIPKD